MYIMHSCVFVLWFTNLLQLTESKDMLKQTMKACPGLEQMLPNLHSMYEKVMVENTSLITQASTRNNMLSDAVVVIGKLIHVHS